MKGSTVRHQYACLLLGFCLVSSLPQSASASNNGPLAASLASDLVQSRAQISIFRHDDQTCVRFKWPCSVRGLKLQRTVSLDLTHAML